MRILGIDPGYAIVGYGAVRAAAGRYETIEYGAVTTRAGDDFGLRLKEIYEGMTELITALRPQAAAVEKLYFTNNKTTGIGVAEARGVILLTLAQAGVPLYEYTPMQVKQSVTGYGKAQKRQVQEMAASPIPSRAWLLSMWEAWPLSASPLWAPLGPCPGPAARPHFTPT